MLSFKDGAATFSYTCLLGKMRSSVSFTRLAQLAWCSIEIRDFSRLSSHSVPDPVLHSKPVMSAGTHDKKLGLLHLPAGSISIYSRGGRVALATWLHWRACIQELVQEDYCISCQPGLARVAGVFRNTLTGRPPARTCIYASVVCASR